MNTSPQESQDAEISLRTAVEQVISNWVKQTVKVVSMVRLTEADRRSAVFRCTDETGGTFIVKQSPKYSPESLSHWEDAPWAIKAFFNDWIGAEFLSGLSMEEKISPQFYGGDAQAGFFVLEDLGEHHSLVDPLLRGTPQTAEDMLMRFATSLARMHAITAGKAGEYEALYRERFPLAKPFANELHEIDQLVEKVKENLQELGVLANPALEGEFQRIVETVSHPGPFLAYIHADPCPDNQFDQGNRYLLIDFEISHFGHALFDAVYPRMIWQSCWCANRLPGDVVRRWEARYREELAGGIPIARENAVWEEALIQLCGFKMLLTLNSTLKEALQEDYEWGIATIRQRVLARLDAFITSTEEFNRLPAMRRMAGEVLPILTTRWHETPGMPLYPAFLNE